MPGCASDTQEMAAAEEQRGEKVAVVVGAGLVGALAAVYMAKRGYRVEVFEKRAGACFFL